MSVSLVRKDPNAPPVVRRKKNQLHQVVVSEVSSVEEGANQFSDVILAKGIRKAIDVFLDETASAGPSHGHGAAELPDGPISSATYRFGPGGAEDHEHTVFVTETLEPGTTVQLVSSIGGPLPHQHNVTITATERIMAGRNDRLLAKVLKAAATGAIDADALESLFKLDDDEPRSFAEHQMDRRLDFLDNAFDERARSLMMATFEILMSDVGDKEPLILAAVDDFAAVMRNDVPRLMSGELAKSLTELVSADSPPSFDDVCDCVAKQLPPGGNGGSMSDLWKGLRDDQKVALTKVWEAAKAGGEAIVLVDASGKALALANVEIDRLKKAVTGDTGDPDLHPLLKGKSDAEIALLTPVLKLMETQDETSRTAITGLQVQLAETKKAHRDGELLEMAKSLESLGVPEAELVATLQSAETAGVLDTLMKGYKAANEAARKGMKEIGVTGHESVGLPSDDAATAHEAVLAKAEELRKGRESEITHSQAYREAIEEMPQEAAIAAGVAVN